MHFVKIREKNFAAYSSTLNILSPQSELTVMSVCEFGGIVLVGLST
jgi:hypothetical protein